MVKAVLFDVDGVLVDSREANIAVYEKLLQLAGYPIPSRAAILGCFHLPLWQSIEVLTGITDQTEVKRIWDLVHDPSLRSPELYMFPDGLDEVLAALHTKYQLGVVTSRVKVGMDDVFVAKDMRHLFDVVVTVEDCQNPKPHPEPLQLALKQLGHTPDVAIYIGDSHTDIQAAHAAQMRSIHLSTQPHKLATASITDFGQIVEAIERLDSATV